MVLPQTLFSLLLSVLMFLRVASLLPYFMHFFLSVVLEAVLGANGALFDGSWSQASTGSSLWKGKAN